ncbi:haloacid dehalogenase-like hydrolase family protein [Mycobacterium xenopi 3993]|nr:haloacid dehalogenase-like hydrolase family protein [Mycobacterium xenopi 3993]
MTLPALIASDVDGTLLDGDDKISPGLAPPFTRPSRPGYVHSRHGRPPRWVRPVVDELGFAPMAVCANGAVIYDSASDRVVSARMLPVDTLAELAEIATRVIRVRGWRSNGSALA